MALLALLLISRIIINYIYQVFAKEFRNNLYVTALKGKL